MARRSTKSHVVRFRRLTWTSALVTLAASLLTTTLSAPLTAQPNGERRTQPSIVGSWRVSVGRVAPWAIADSARLDTRRWVGQTIQFAPERVTGPSVLRCANARYQPTVVPAEGLFQGGLTAPAADVAKGLGFATFPVSGTSVTCDNGIFEFHRADANALLVAVDNVIWTLDRSAGAAAPATSPNGVVQRFLEAHFSGGLRFDSTTFSARAPWFTATLRSRAMRYLSQPVSTDEAPVLDGDPFTYSQEYPTRFSVGAAAVNAKGVATVAVRFSDGYSTRTVTYVLQRGTTWRIADVRYPYGSSLMSDLATPPGK